MVLRLLSTILGLSLAFSAEASAPPEVRIKYLGSYDEEFAHGGAPSRLSLDDSQKELYVINKNSGILTFNNEGMEIQNIPLQKTPSAFALSPKGDLYLSYGDNAVHLLDFRGSYKKAVDLSAVPDHSDLAVQALHVDKEGNLYIGDGAQNRVIVLTARGKLSYLFGEWGKLDGQFFNIKAITTDEEKIYLVDPTLFRVSVFQKGGKFLYKFGRISSRPGGFSMPMGIDSDKGWLYVVDTNRAMVIIFTDRGELVTEFGGVGVHGGSLFWPSDIAVEGDKVYVADAGNSRIQVYQLTVDRPERSRSFASPSKEEKKGKDSDNDGLADPVDICPASAGTVQNRGCPSLEKGLRPVELTSTEKWALTKAFRRLLFPSGQTGFQKSSGKHLKPLLRILKGRHDYILHIAGHTDNEGSARSNRLLGKKRAESVKRYFLSRGISPERIFAVSYGETRPVASNVGKEGRAKNRRVEFTLVKKE